LQNYAFFTPNPRNYSFANQFLAKLIMKSLNRVKEFIFDRASYNLSDGGLMNVSLRMDYKNNKYAICDNNGKMTKEFKEEVDKIARNLLQRKHGVNFVDRLKM
jgi:hypothetical protein